MASPSRKPLYSLHEELEDVTGLKATVVLLKTACQFARDGKTRCQVKEIVGRAQEDHGLEVEYWEAGQIFKAMGVRTATSQGRGRLVLDPTKLEEAYRQISDEADRLAAKIGDSLRGLEGISESLNELMTRQNEAISLVNKENEIRRYLFQHQGIENRVTELEVSYEAMRAEAGRAEELETTVNSMEAMIQSLPSLEAREKALREGLVSYESKAEELSLREEGLGHGFRSLERRYRQVELVEIEQAIHDSKAELDTLRKQLGEKRSLASRLLGRNI